MHSDADVDNDTGKPVMILDYNKTKAAVDRVDQLRHYYSVQKRTKRWPLTYFFNCLNISGINSHELFQAKYPEWNANRTRRRRLFLENLGMQLLQPWLQLRAQIPQLPKSTKRALIACGAAAVTKVPNADQGSRKRKRCRVSHASADRKTADRRSNCGEPCFVHHKTVNAICSYCDEQ